MQQRRGTAAQWTAANPTLGAGEIGFETDTNKFKIGNGSSNWAALSYFANTAGLEALLNDGAPAALNTLNEIAAAINDDPAFFTTVATNLSTHISDETGIHGIEDTSVLATFSYVTDAIASVTGDYASLAGTGISWNSGESEFEIDNTVATVSALTDHNSDTTGVHGIADTAELATKSYADTAEADAKTYADTGISTHNSDTTSVHGIADTADLATKTYADGAVTTHSSDTTSVHGIADTSVLETTSGAQSKADTAVSTHNDDTTNVHGISDTSILATTTGSQTLTNKTLTTPTINGPTITATGQTPTIHGIYLPAPHDIVFEGTTANDFETTLTAGEPTADNTVTLPDASGTLQLRVANVSDTEIGYLNGVTSAIQTQIDAKAPLSAPTFTGTVTSTNDLVVDGNLTVNGTTFNASSTSITIEDNMLQLSHQNAANTVDLGLVVGYNDGAAKHAGLVRDVSDDEWKLFKGVTTEPTTTVNFGQGSLDNLELNNLVAAGVVFTDGTQTKEGVPSRTPIVQKTASYELSTLTHRDSLIEVSSASATTVTIPLDATVNYPVGTTVDILQTNTGQVTIAGAVGVTVNSTPGLKLRTRWSSATLMKRAANTWVVYGDLTA